MLRDAFVGVMSHELRTPVTTIYGAAKLLAKQPRRDELETLVEDIEEEADRLYRITEDLLVLSRAEHGLVEIRPEPVLVQRLVPSVVAEVGRRFAGLQVSVDLAPALPPIAGDEAALRQVLVNLLTNAAKYGDGQPVRVAADADAGHVRVRVEDHGPGLPEAELAPIFDLFYRSNVNARRASGTGIGLYVVRQLVHAMHGHGVRVRRGAAAASGSSWSCPPTPRSRPRCSPPRRPGSGRRGCRLPGRRRSHAGGRAGAPDRDARHLADARRRLGVEAVRQDLGEVPGAAAVQERDLRPAAEPVGEDRRGLVGRPERGQELQLGDRPRHRLVARLRPEAAGEPAAPGEHGRGLDPGRGHDAGIGVLAQHGLLVAVGLDEGLHRVARRR